MKSYYMFVASLPPLPSEFDAGPIPITASTLGDRLSLLDDQDRHVLDQLADFFRWDRQPVDRSDAEVIEKHQQLRKEVHNPLVRKLIHHRFQMRTLVAAVRCQRDGLPMPMLPDMSVSKSIRRYWNQPYFQLITRVPWLEKFCRALDDAQPQLAQRHLFDELWRLWSRLNQRYHFSFESIVLYLARWEILHRWSSQNADRGRERFDHLVDEILQETNNN
ncbi:hypothetical protein Q31b_02700 [Novipirellula aureliae]|uniref:DUF2764 family protein n=1 Tax=Novipirellula aureliae TaxID=2527966 RepID=A0A5C6ED14_9BACT|nr:DUF2764 family protein [Novipirellula aureliae]TWU45099.1 hypothetical protein Q31b_02700 [Novipirellula aureliae]